MGDQRKVSGKNGGFSSTKYCAIQISGVKLATRKNMYKTDESDLDNSDNNPPSMGGWNALISRMNIT